MFNEFDTSLFNDPNFKEDSVREEIVVPILRRLGYRASGPNQIVRSKQLIHPFVMIGSKPHKIYIIPDYLLFSDGRPGFVLDAKRPDAKLIRSTHAEQAYSYAIHPEVRVRFYALCNGRQLIAYDIYEFEPIFAIEFGEIDSKWDIIKSVLSPENVSFAIHSHLDPDFGIAMLNLGAAVGQGWLFPFVKLDQIAWAGDDLFSSSTGLVIGDVDHLISFDFDRSVAEKVLAQLDAAARNRILRDMRPGQQILLNAPIYVSLDTLIGDPTRGEHDTFVPFLVRDIKLLDEATYRAAQRLAQSTN